MAALRFSKKRLIQKMADFNKATGKKINLLQFGPNLFNVGNDDTPHTMCGLTIKEASMYFQGYEDAHYFNKQQK